jgi:hypothetical protein
MPDFDFDIPNPDDFFDRPRLARELFRDFERPIDLAIRYGPSQIKILVLCDSSASYSETAGFGLGIALKDAFDSTHPDHPSYARFTFTKAHRGTATGTTANFNNFTFTAGSLDAFDELWLFGVTAGAPYLSNAEVAVIEQFMDRGGGVLAMGDHEDLGLGLCGNIKRVRSMRKWWFSSPPPPAGMEVAPATFGSTLNDTIIQPGGQSDDVPQKIRPNYRLAWAGWRPWFRVKYPHPILCGPRGVITVLPDHQHEGACIVPNAAFANEYPGGVKAEVIARAVDHSPPGVREFGVIGAWDGHNPAAKKGRVVVDATWHHWFNINLTGLKGENGNEYKDVLAYFRNVAIWLAPTDRHVEMRRAGQLIFMIAESMIEHTLTLRELRPERFYVLGVHARDVIGRIAPKCQSAGWFFEIVSPHLSGVVLKRLEAFDPDDLDNRFEAAVLDNMICTVFGGIVNAIAVEINKVGVENIEKLHRKLDDIGAAGAKAGMEQASAQFAKAQRSVKALIG